MKLSQIINFPLGLFGLKIIRKSRLVPVNISDIELDQKFLQLYSKVKEYTLVPLERCYTLYQTIQYIIKNKIEGDLVECGVWKGGSCMLMAYTLMDAGITNRKIYMYDTFAGMTKPGEMDGNSEKEEWEKGRKTDTLNSMCYSPLEEVKANMNRTGYPTEQIVMVKGKVEETLPGILPSTISLLRLDTDWYESTKHELLHLYPLLVKHAVLIVDDYGAWQGARKAVDEYFSAIPNTFLGRIDYTGRIIIK